MIDAEKKLQRARAALILDQPFFGTIALRLKTVIDETCETGWTDGRTLGFNPDWIDSLSMDQAKGFLAHEVQHIANCHHTRRQGRDPELWNDATDHAINPLIQEAGFVLPQGSFQGIGDLSAEAIYSKLKDRQQDPDGQPDDQSSPDDQDDDSQDGQCQGDVDQEDEDGTGHGDNDDGGQDGTGDDENGQNQNNGADNSKSGQEGHGDPGGCGEVRDLPGQDGQPASPAEMAQEESETKVMVLQAAQAAKSQGNLPAGIARMIEDMLTPVIDWRAILAQFIQATAKNDHRWNPPNRRFVWQGIYLPSCINEEIGEIVTVIDTSGSVTQAEIDQFAAELTQILEAYDMTCHVLYCDTQIANVQTFTRQDLPLSLEPMGYGGTDFRPPFKWVEDEGLDPACLIYFTDLECSDFPEEPPYPVLWAYNGSHGTTPPFGEVIEID